MEFIWEYLQPLYIILCFVVLSLVYFSSSGTQREEQTTKALPTVDGRRHNYLFNLVPGMSRVCSNILGGCGGRGVCAHVKSQLVLRDGTTLGRNRSKTEGYCIQQADVKDSGP